MATTSESLAFDRGIRPVMEIVLPEKADAIIGFRADPELQARIEELAGKSTEGELTEDERAEYAGYVRANKFVAILKRQGCRSRRYNRSLNSSTVRPVSRMMLLSVPFATSL